MEAKFYFCRHCGNVIIKFVDGGPVPSCCGEEMVELKANTTDATKEKHVPCVTKVNDCTIKVAIGSEPHPMTPEHHIQFIYLETENGGQLQRMHPGTPAEVTFCCTDKIRRVFEYCNIHGLWKTELCSNCTAGEKLAF
ncbi:MAG: desulfoferrodoxin [Bacteroidales bacterium]|nr:desulfoferrodoxin [Candidatus Cacconaster merdequi]